jgi:hypothetical protein
MQFRVGYQIQPQHCTVQQIREAYRAADSLRVDTLWVWDHMFPLYGPPDGNHFACMPLLAAIAVEGHRILALQRQLVIQNVQHFEKRHIAADILGFVSDHAARITRVLLPPDVESDVHL